LAAVRQRVDQHVHAVSNSSPSCSRCGSLICSSSTTARPRSCKRREANTFGTDACAVERAFQVRRLDRKTERGHVGLGSHQDAVGRRRHVQLTRAGAGGQVDDHPFPASLRSQQELAQAGRRGAARVEPVESRSNRPVTRGSFAQRSTARRSASSGERPPLPSPERKPRTELDDAAFDLDAQPRALRAGAAAAPGVRTGKTQDQEIDDQKPERGRSMGRAQ
jgi:hypothetical protein